MKDEEIEKKHKKKRGFTTKKEGQEWERRYYYSDLFLFLCGDMFQYVSVVDNENFIWSDTTCANRRCGICACGKNE